MPRSITYLHTSSRAPALALALPTQLGILSHPGLFIQWTQALNSQVSNSFNHHGSVNHHLQPDPPNTPPRRRLHCLQPNLLEHCRPLGAPHPRPHAHLWRRLPGLLRPRRHHLFPGSASGLPLCACPGPPAHARRPRHGRCQGRRGRFSWRRQCLGPLEHVAAGCHWNLLGRLLWHFDGIARHRFPVQCHGKPNVHGVHHVLHRHGTLEGKRRRARVVRVGVGGVSNCARARRAIHWPDLRQAR